MSVVTAPVSAQTASAQTQRLLLPILAGARSSNCESMDGMSEETRGRFDLYLYGSLSVLCPGTAICFLMHLPWRQTTVLSFSLMAVAGISAIAGTYRAWRKTAR